MLNPPSENLLSAFETLLGPRGFSRRAEDMAPWLTDWRGRWHGQTAALLSPNSTEQVQAIISRCMADRVAVVPQGGNTSLAGGATPPAAGHALLLSLRRLRNIRDLSTEDAMIIAEAGVILSEVHDAAASIDLRFPLSLGAKGSATVGGLISTNAGGTQVLRFGTMRSLVLGLEAVLPDGSLYKGLSSLRKDNRGYDLKQLLIGAEGTLGVVTAATLKLFAEASSKAVAWGGLSSPMQALRVLRRLESEMGEAVESFELVPADALEMVLAHVPGTRPPLERSHDWNILIEAAAPKGKEAAEMLGAALTPILEEGLIADAVIAGSQAQAESLWRLRDSIAEAERKQGFSLKHDISVPVSAMPLFLHSGQQKVEAHFPGSKVLAFGHLGDGNIHFNVRPPADQPATDWLSERGPEVSDLIYDLVAAAGGSISAEHGIGQMKVEALARTAEQATLAAQQAIKVALDPAGIMNPGKIFPPH